MSSRKGNILLFSDMRRMIEQMIRSKYASSDTIDDETIRRISIASINYGMLNHDCLKDIVFEMEKWTNNTGNTGPYMLYAYSRIQSILYIRDDGYEGKKFDLGHKLRQLGIHYQSYVDTNTHTINFPKFLQSKDGQRFLAMTDYDRDLCTTNERLLLFQFHRYWCVLLKAKQTNNSSIICEYIFQISQLFSSWYEHVRLTQVPLESIPSKVVLLQCTSTILHSLLLILNIQPVQKM
uniref:arginine--tRNA ligase n=1 Tax=Lygus hesperus TaxID=30085 RepID=A0A0A9YYA8_LYGHE